MRMRTLICSVFFLISEKNLPLMLLESVFNEKKIPNFRVKKESFEKTSFESSLSDHGGTRFFLEFMTTIIIFC